MALSMRVLEDATTALRAECNAQFGAHRHVFNGKAWNVRNAASASATATAAALPPAPAMLFSHKMPWCLLEAEGAGAVLDTQHYSRNPLLQIGVGGARGNELHATVAVFAEVVCHWDVAGTRISMKAEPRAFATQHAVLFDVQPRQWEVPPLLAGAVSPVLLRLDDATSETRFWIVCPVASALLDPSRASWCEFSAQLCVAAARSEPLAGFCSVLAPILPGHVVRNPIASVDGLVHPITRSASASAAAAASGPLPLACIDATLSCFVQFDECGVDDALPLDACGEEEEEEEEEDEDEDEDERARADPASEIEMKDTVKDEAKAKAKAKAKPKPKPKPKALVFGADSDVLIAVCDTRTALPLLTVVVKNEDLHALEFVDAEAGASAGSNSGSDALASGPLPWPLPWSVARQAREWFAWTPTM